MIQTGECCSKHAGLYITSDSSTYSELGLKQSKMWEKGTLCITIAANIAKTAILEFDACFPDSVVGFIGNERTNIFLIHYWFSFFQAMPYEFSGSSSRARELNLNPENCLGISKVDCARKKETGSVCCLCCPDRQIEISILLLRIYTQ